MGNEGVAGQEDTAASVAVARVLADNRTSAASTRRFHFLHRFTGV
jgi:hypothetical protein